MNFPEIFSTADLGPGDTRDRIVGLCDVRSQHEEQEVPEAQNVPGSGPLESQRAESINPIRYQWH